MFKLPQNTIFNSLVVVFDGKSRNIEKELSLRFTDSSFYSYILDNS